VEFISFFVERLHASKVKLLTSYSMHYFMTRLEKFLASSFKFEIVVVRGRDDGLQRWWKIWPFSLGD